MSGHRHNGGTAGGKASEDIPAFAELYDATTMTPRIAYWLWSTAIYLADTWRGASDDPQLLQEWLPPIARPLGHGAWLEQFIDCFETLADRIATRQTGVDGLSRCTGEEMPCTSSSTSQRHTSTMTSSAPRSVTHLAYPTAAMPTRTST